MKSVQQILARLETLSKADRQWIVKHLPEQAKAVLMNELSGEAASTGNGIERKKQAVSSATDPGQIEGIDPGVAASVLATEPGWITVALLQSANDAWAKQVINELPTQVRSVASATMRDTPPLSGPVVMSLRRTLLLLAATESQETQFPEKPRWRQWIDSIWIRGNA